jgi:hypothetical protein
VKVLNSEGSCDGRRGKKIITLLGSTEIIDGTPEKRLFLSIIADYDLTTSICELVDNAVDHWTSNSRPDGTQIDIFMNADRQTISVVDNAGGVPAEQMRLLITPGASRVFSSAELIGTFGVGGKRAGIALGERVEIISRHDDSPATRLVIDNEWLRSDSWEIEAKRVDEGEVGKTTVRISELRQGFNYAAIEDLKVHLAAAYYYFIKQGCKIKINGTVVGATSFDVWAFPPEYPPRVSSFTISPNGSDQLSVNLAGGLILDRDPEAENYGVYVYCNDRLIVSHVKNHEVGYIKGEAGVPHPDASLCRVILRLNGPPELMPWASNKSALNYSHPTFLELREKIIHLTTYYSTLSRRMKNDREEGVYKYQTGEVAAIDLSQPGTQKKVVLPPVPRGRSKPYPDRLMDENARVFERAPWTRGLVEAMGVVDGVARRNIDSKGRIALVLLDSNLEIGLKEYIVHQTDKFPPQKFSDVKIAELFKARHLVINAVKPIQGITDSDWGKVSHFYNMRNKLIHERATVQISERDVEDYRNLVSRILFILFGLKFQV